MYGSTQPESDHQTELKQALYARSKQHLLDLLKVLPKGYRLTLIGRLPGDVGHEFFLSQENFDDLHTLLNVIEQTAQTMHGPKGLN